MVTGEEVVAEVVETKVGASVLSYVLKRPHILQFQQIGQGQLGLALVPWTLSNPTIERLDVPAAAVVLSFDPSAEVERQYLQQTSGISILPPGAF
jgi:hypothetical protein